MDTNNSEAKDRATQTSSEKLAEQKKENWQKFWKIMKVMPLFFIMPFTAFGKMQEVLMPPTPESKTDSH